MSYKKYLSLLKSIVPLELDRDQDDPECLQMRKEMDEIWGTLTDGCQSKLLKLEIILKKEILNRINSVVVNCKKCPVLCKNRTQTVFGCGDANAQIVLLGEAPGKDEDEQGVPFVGKAGKLLDKILDAANLSRNDVYILNILKCRPPKNRDPLPDEADNCSEYLNSQIKCIRPNYILCLGRVAAQNLLKTKQSLSSLRKTWHVYGRCKVLCTYHPAYLLRNPNAKKDAWEDWEMLLQDMGALKNV